MSFLFCVQESLAKRGNNNGNNNSGGGKNGNNNGNCRGRCANAITGNNNGNNNSGGGKNGELFLLLPSMHALLESTALADVFHVYEG